MHFIFIPEDGNNVAEKRALNVSFGIEYFQTLYALN